MKEKQTLYKCIIITQQFINHYYQRHIDLCIPYIDENIVFIGAYDFQYTYGKEEFIKTFKQRIKEETDKVKINIIHDQYALISHNAHIWSIECCYFTHTTMPDHRYLLAKTRSTFVWKRKKETWSLLHLHTSHARDVPLIYDSPMKENTLEKYSTWFDYFNNMDILENKNKRSVYTDVNGIIHYLLPIEIIYVQVNDKLCTIYTFDEPVIVRSSLTYILKQSSFLTHVHKQFLVNNLYVKSIKRYQLTLVNDLTIPVSQKDYLLIKKYLGIIK